MRGNQLSLLVCSNRKKQPYNFIWKNILTYNNLVKIILVTQGKANKRQVHGSKIMQIKHNNIGRSKAINRGLEEITTSLIGLTDDDCHLGSDWAKQAVTTMNDLSIDLVFGQTLPFQPKKHNGEICPCTFAKNPNTFSITSKIYRHWVDVGFDNNVVIRKKVFDTIGGYKPWLGPGSIGKGADDAEFIIRALIAGYKIAYNPLMIAYHNKWLSQTEWNDQSRVYWSGGIAAYGFYAFQGVSECQQAMICHIQHAINCMKEKLKSVIRKPWKYYSNIFGIMVELFFLCKGLTLAIIYARIIPIPDSENVVKRFYK